MQPMKEMRQLLYSLKISVQNLKNDIEGIVKVQCDPNSEGESFDQAVVCIRTAEIKRLKNLLNDALKYAKYYNNLETTQFENLLNDDELKEDEYLMYKYDADSDDENLDLILSLNEF
jgi:hypothetical protein